MLRELRRFKQLPPYSHELIEDPKGWLMLARDIEDLILKVEDHRGS
jgi:hypothetical protein